MASEQDRVTDDELQHSLHWQGSMDKTVLLHDAPYIRRLSRDLLDSRTQIERVQARNVALERVLREAQQVDISAHERAAGYELVTQAEDFWDRFRPVRERIDAALEDTTDG